MAKLCAECNKPIARNRLFRIYLWPGGYEKEIQCCSTDCLGAQIDKYEAWKKEQP